MTATAFSIARSRPRSYIRRMERHTRQRAAIRETFAAAARPLSMQEVHLAARRQARGLGIATVYRTVKALVESGALQVVELPGEPPRYEPAGMDHHHHFHCRGCDRVYDIEGCPGQLRALLPRNFRLERHELVLYGQCATCLRTG